MSTLFRIFNMMVATYIIMFGVTYGQQCHNIKVKRKMITEEHFQSLMKKRYKEVTSIAQCLAECKTDEKCTDIILCNGGCHLLGVFITNVLTTENYATCKLFPMDRCKNGGQQEDDGYCNCPVGFGGRYCELIIEDKCYNTWREVYDTEGNVTKNDLLNEASKQCPVSLKITLGRSVKTVEDYGRKDEDIWAQISHQLAKTSWDSFETSPIKRRFDSVRTSRYMTTMQYSVEGNLVSSSSTTVAVKLFVKQHTADIPDFVSNTNANAINFERLVEKINNGASVSLFKTIFVNLNQSLVAAEFNDDVGSFHTATKDTFIIQSGRHGYKKMNKYTSSGYNYNFRWYIGGSINTNPATRPASKSWCTNDCWRKVLTVEVNGSVSFGSAFDLVSSVVNAHGVRVYFNGIAAKTKTIYINHQTVTALLQDMLDPLDVGILSSSGTVHEIMVSTSGAVAMRGHTFETGTIVSETEEQRSVQWFTDTRQWIRVLVVDGDGTKRYGSLTKLKNFVMAAASLKLVVVYDSGLRQVMDVDHVDVTDDGSLAADIIHHSAVVVVDDCKISFDSATSYQRWSAIITTHGQFKKYHYTFKRNDGNTMLITDVSTFSWFIQQ